MQCQSGVAAYWLEFGIVGAPVIQDLRAAVFTGGLPMPCWCRLCCTTLGSFRVVEMSYSSSPSHDETVNERLVADSDDEFAHLRIDRSEASLRDDVVLSSSEHVMSYVKRECARWQHDETSEMNAWLLTLMMSLHT